MNSTFNHKISFIGGGNIARCMIGGLLDQGISSEFIRVADPNPEARQKAESRFGVFCTEHGQSIAEDSDVVVLAVKPQVISEVTAGLKEALDSRQALVVSVAAGITTSMVNQWLGGGQAIVRMMPNTPALVGESATGMFANHRVTEQQKEWAWHMAQAVGVCSWMEQESLIDVVTAVSGSGPAYYFFLTEMLIQAGVAQGLTDQQARDLVLQTAIGAAKMMQQSTDDPTTLRAKVTSPGGTTERAIGIMNQGNLPDLIQQAVDGAVTRGHELAAAAGESK